MGGGFLTSDEVIPGMAPLERSSLTTEHIPDSILIHLCRGRQERWECWFNRNFYMKLPPAFSSFMRVALKGIMLFFKNSQPGLGPDLSY